MQIILSQVKVRFIIQFQLERKSNFHENECGNWEGVGVIGSGGEQDGSFSTNLELQTPPTLADHQESTSVQLPPPPLLS